MGYNAMADNTVYLH